uniref:Uncharacterized protein n=1 Tax=Nelumbo nucifera TaxID=4432 RepID=A0A822YNA3_NELNU|nr:TPA_asm: hypothetical protein HUJ06_004710 [Nelumbo nucifera]
MAAKKSIVSIRLILLLTSSLCISSIPSNSYLTDPPPTPTPWPHQFHSLLYMNSSGTLQIVDLWYDWPNGRNFNIIQNQLGMSAHVMTFEVGAVLEDEKWQAPVYCFKNEEERNKLQSVIPGGSQKGLADSGAFRGLMGWY